MSPTEPRLGPHADVTVVVLAGGTSRRFGSDKLAAAYAGTDLLTATVTALDPSWSVVVVGPRRDVGRPVRFTREDPPGSGPAAALLTGIRIATTEVVITLPGDSPHPFRPAHRLIEALSDHDLVVASGDRPNPLWLGLRGAGLGRVRGFDPNDWVDRSAASLIRAFEPTIITVPPRWLTDVDVPEDLRRAADTREHTP